MRIGELISFFSQFEILPVHTGDVIDQIMEKGVCDQINIYDVNIDPEILRGFFHQHEMVTAYRHPLDCADIYIAEGQSIEWRRLVCCKELLHLMDDAQFATTSRVDVDNLLSRIVFPTLVQDIPKENIQVIQDRFGFARALAVLLPMSARNDLMDDYKNGRKTDADIANHASKPEKWVSFVMSEFWDELHERMLRH